MIKINPDDNFWFVIGRFAIVKRKRGRSPLSYDYPRGIVCEGGEWKPLCGIDDLFWFDKNKDT